MDKTIVIYKSKYGSTEKYARWIGEELDCPVVSLDDFKLSEIDQYDNVIYGGGVQAGGVKGFDKIKKKAKAILKDPSKKIVVFAVGIGLASTEARQQLRDINFSKANLNAITCYFLPGAYDPSKVTGMDKALMNMVTKMLEKKSPSEVTEDDEKLLNTVKNGGDFVERKNIDALVAEFK